MTGFEFIPNTSGEVTYRDVDRFSVEDVQLACPLLREAWEAINGESASEIVPYQVNGKEILVPKIEAILYSYFTYGCQVRLALQSGQGIAIMVYLRVFDDTIAVRLSYVKPSHRKQRVSHTLVDSLAPKPKILLFQTRNDAPPTQVHGFTGVRRVKLSDGPSLETWMMSWEPTKTQGEESNG